MRKKATVSGGISVLIILMMIALSAFALLALYAARSNHVLAEKNANRIKAYYQLDTSAREAVVSLNRLFSNLGDQESGMLTVDGERALLEQEWTIVKKSPLTVSRKVSQESMHIQVTLALRQDGAASPQWEVLSWAASQDDFDYNTGLNVWLGEDIGASFGDEMTEIFD